MSMDSYITESIDKLLKEMMKTIKTPVGNHHFKVKKVCIKLCEIDKIILNRLLSKLLFLSYCAQPDIQPTIALPTMRVRNLDKDD